MPEVPTTNSVTLELESGKEATIEGFKTLRKTEVFKITYCDTSGYVPRSLFVGKKSEARDRLQRQGVIITSDSDWRGIINGIEDVSVYLPAPLLESPGWTGDYFAQANGRVYSPPGSPKGRAIFERNHLGNSSKGSLRDWKKLIAAPLTGQHLPMIATMAAFAAPLLELSGESHNFGFEFCGPPATGKTTCLALMASIAGDPSHIANFNVTKAGLEGMFSEYRDLPFPIDEANLADSKDLKFMKDFAFRMANGTAKVTAFQPNRAQVRFIFATTANRAFHYSLYDFDSDTAGAALQRLIPLQVDRSNPLGVFNFLPEQFASSGELASHISHAINQQFGTPMRAFLKALIKAQPKSSDRFVSKLRERMEHFATKVGVAATTQGKTRATTAFGLIFAAGSFAQAKGILPKEWDCMAACLAGYANYQLQLPEQTPLASRLVTIARLESTLDIRGRALPQLSNEEFERHGAFLKLGTNKRVELLFTNSVKRRFFRDWKAIENSADFRACNLRDVDHATKQRQVRENVPQERFFCFVLDQQLLGLLEGKPACA